MTSAVAALAYLLLGVAAAFQACLAAGAPWARCAYGGRFTTADGRLPAAFRAGSAGAVLVLGLAAIVVHTHLLAVLWVLAAFFLLNTVGNLGGRHPVERWGLSAVTLALTAAFVALALG